MKKYTIGIRDANRNVIIAKMTLDLYEDENVFNARLAYFRNCVEDHLERDGIQMNAEEFMHLFCHWDVNNNYVEWDNGKRNYLFETIEPLQPKGTVTTQYHIEVSRNDCAVNLN